MDLYLRSISLEDSSDLLEIFQDNNIMDYLLMDYISDYDEMLLHIKKYYSCNEMPTKVIVDKDSLKVIGLIELHTIENNSGEIGIYINSKYHGNSIGYECLKLYIDTLFKETHISSVYYKTLQHNIVAIKLASKLGFKQLNVENYEYNNKIHKIVVFEKEK